MKLSNFKMEKVKKRMGLPLEYFASVDVETGCLFWKKSTRRQIYSDSGLVWYFVDSGEFTPGQQAETLMRMWRCQQRIEDAE